ncbi:two-component sensor histidine kinase [Streptomyces sp. PKU-EA00015]|uniref:sensor histidine kinase n=1 Tax=Streptomyces sp. PKU-EA00015 TaxID=2748326 RepID=UPI0015A1134B|nr:histidine kinase [Streptomyces sp. PKU-EA00015]NWF25057.1 two-component sensor histidine kinase [Streptomyces sp. PKU-EA00015]
MPFPRPHRDDVLIAAVCLLGGLLLWSLGVHTNGPYAPLPSWVTLVPLVALAGLELLRRTMPRTTLIAGTAAVVVDPFTPGSIVSLLMFADIVYAAVVYGPPASARRIPVTTGMITLAVTIGFLAWLREPSALLIGLVTGLVSFGPATTGAIVRNHREAAEAARLRAEQTALLAEMDRTQAVVAERARMARELHDMVANHLSAIAIHSTAALSLDDAATTRQALTVIRENSVEGLAEMRRLIGLLRDSSGDAEPAAAPTLAGLDALVEQARTNGASSGLTFTLHDVRERGARLPAPVELAAYRIVQESLTNAIKHAEEGEVLVEVSNDGGCALTVTVTSPFGRRPGPRAPGSGAGLVGMQERVALLDGTFEAGPAAWPAPGTGKIWRVRAELPVPDDKEPSA